MLCSSTEQSVKKEIRLNQNAALAVTFNTHLLPGCPGNTLQKPVQIANKGRATINCKADKPAKFRCFAMIISSAVFSDRGIGGCYRRILPLGKTGVCKDSQPSSVVRSRVDTISHLPNNARFYTARQWRSAGSWIFNLTAECWSLMRLLVSVQAANEFSETAPVVA